MPTEVDKYQTAGSNVVLDVIVGDANPGQISVSLADHVNHTTTPIASGSSVKAVNLGPGPSLVGKVLVVSSVVQAAQPATLWTSTTVALSGGTQDANLPQSEKASAANANVNFLFVITFT
jgi:hypothetical protein